MRKLLTAGVASLMLLLAVGATSCGSEPATPSTPGPSPASSARSLTGPTPAPTAASWVGGPHVPDRSRTPGLADPAAHAGGGDANDVCVSGYSAAHRGSIPTSTRAALFGSYGLAYPQPAGSFELDHLIPLELGGVTDTRNLFPETVEYPGFKEKDRLENYLHRETCAGRMPLTAAQQRIASDWIGAWYAAGLP